MLAAATFIAAFIIVYNRPQEAAMTQAMYMGRTIFLAHGLPTVLGSGTFSAPASAWRADGWLGGLGSYAFSSPAALFFVSVLIAASAFVLTERRCRRRGLGDGETALALAIVVSCSLGALRVGGGMLDVFFTALFFLFIECAPSRSAWWAIPITVVWCNASIYGYIAPFWAALSSAGRSFGPTQVDRLRRAAFYISPLAAMLASPETIHIFRHYIAYLRLDPSMEIHTWQAGIVSPSAFYGGFLPAMIAAAYCGLRRAGISDTVTAIGAVFLVLLNGQYLGVAGVVLGPIVATAWASLREEKERELQRYPLRDNVAIAATVMIAAMLAGFYADKHDISPTHGEASRQIDQIASDGREHRLFCVDVAWCDYAVWLASPKVRVFMDDRRGYPKKVLDDMRTLAHADGTWRKKLDAWRITDVITPGAQMEGLLALLPDWTCVSSTEKIWMCKRKP